jgi:hypothetical protein
MSGQDTIQSLETEIARLQELARKVKEKQEKEGAAKKVKAETAAHKELEEHERKEKVKAERIRKLAEDAGNMKVPKRVPGVAIAKSSTTLRDSSGEDAPGFEGQETSGRGLGGGRQAQQLQALCPATQNMPVASEGSWEKLRGVRGGTHYVLRCGPTTPNKETAREGEGEVRGR